MSDAEVKLITIGCPHLQRRNKLKGVAMQKLILSTIENQKEDISIKKILKMCSGKVSEYYWVHSPFKTKNKSFLKRYEVLNSSELESEEIISVNEMIINKEWKYCSVCNNPRPADVGVYNEWRINHNLLPVQTLSKKCKKCGEGWFRYNTKKFDSWRAVYMGSKEEIISRLIQGGHLKEVKQQNKRIDFFHFSEGTFYIFESKNKENTELSFGDVVRTLVYPKIIRDCGYPVQKLAIIFNGSFSPEISYAVKEGFTKKFNFEIDFIPIEKYLEQKEIRIKEIIVTKSKSGYDYQIMNGNSDKILIDLTNI